MVYCSNLGQQGDNCVPSVMDKMLEEFLMPPPESAQSSLALRESVDSLRDESCGSIDRANNSSASSSWNSSCSCHSMSAVGHGTRSAFVFHKQPILPPLLCTTSRAEMKIYKVKAVEKEQHRKQKEKKRLISRVEAILSGVEMSPNKQKRPVKTIDAVEEEKGKGNYNEKKFLMLKKADDVMVTGDDSSPNANIDIGRNMAGDASMAGHTHECDHGNQGHRRDDSELVTPCSRLMCDVIISQPDAVVTQVCEKSSSSSSEDDTSSFHDDAYRSSLRNLLQKSLTLSQCGTTNVEKKAPSALSSDSASTSESEEDITENTVIAQKVSATENSTGNCELLLSESSSKLDENEQSSEEEALVSTVVEVALSDAKHHILNEICNQTLLGQNGPGFNDVTDHEMSRNETVSPKNLKCEEISWGTPENKEKVESTPACIPSLLTSEFHNQSTSTKVNFPLGFSMTLEDKTALNNHDNCKESLILPSSEIVELTGTICYDLTIADTCVDGIDGARPITMATPLESTDDLTLLQPTASDTVSDVAVESSSVNEGFPDKDEVKENCDPAMETGSLHSLKRSLSFVLDRPSQALESAVVEAVTQHFQEYQEDGKFVKYEESELAAAKKKKMLHTRVRRGSYTLDEPSPYLVKNRENATIEFHEDDECSEITADTGAPNEVKRKLDLPSDSEEALTPASAEKHQPRREGVVSKAELNVANLCRLLQDQHKQQMESMKKRHEEQLSTLQKELVHGQEEPSVRLDDAVNTPNFYCPPCDVTVSPSLSSTEYRDIRIGGRCHGQHQPVPAGCMGNNERCNENMDVSGIAGVELSTSLHEKLCKFSALCKGHLTRRLLGSHKVQEISRVIRDTSRLLLSLRSEINGSKGMDSVRDTYLEDRLYTQLRSAMYEVQNIFFYISVREKMYIIAHSSAMEKNSEQKAQKVRKISAATQKSLERKQLLSANDHATVHHVACAAKVVTKDVKSKISHIWKSEPTKISDKKSPDPSVKKTSKPIAGPKKASTVISQRKVAKFPVTARTVKPLTSQSAKQFSGSQKSPLKLKSYLKSQNGNIARSATTKEAVTSQKKTMSQPGKSNPFKLSTMSQRNSTSRQPISSGEKKPVPLKSRANNLENRY